MLLWTHKEIQDARLEELGQHCYREIDTHLVFSEGDFLEDFRVLLMHELLLCSSAFCSHKLLSLSSFDAGLL